MALTTTAAFSLLVSGTAGLTVLSTIRRAILTPLASDASIGGPWLWAAPWLGYLLLPLLALVVSGFLLTIGSFIDLKSHGKESKEAVRIILLLPGWFLLTAQNVFLPFSTNPGDEFPGDKFRMFVSEFAKLHLFFGCLIVVVEPNSVIGIITPWTSASTWKALHRKAGYVFAYSFVLLIPVAWFAPIGWPLLVAVLVLVLGPSIICWGIAYWCSSKSNSGADPKATPLCAASISPV